jgi:HAMP domain-containing protein
MFIDEVVIAGVVTVGMMVAFLGGVVWFIWRDSQKPRKSSKSTE